MKVEILVILQWSNGKQRAEISFARSTMAAASSAISSHHSLVNSNLPFSSHHPKLNTCCSISHTRFHQNAKKLSTRCQKLDYSGSILAEQAVISSRDMVPLVKMCGIASVSDAILAAEAGAKFIGMILWPKSKRSISLNIAKEISKVAREYGAESVGVFVEEDATEIQRCCDVANIDLVQLHGELARKAVSVLAQNHRIIYVMHANTEGNLLTDLPTTEHLVDWILIDSLQGGSGKKFDWHKLQVPKSASKYGWLLAGGLNAENVSQALTLLQPEAVDVSSGICGSDGIQKDPTLITSFMNSVQHIKVN